MKEFEDNLHFQAVRDHYGDQRAERSGVLYININHIHEGLVVLDAIQATRHTKEAYCLHPIVQGDESLAIAFATESVLMRYSIDLYSAILAMEYRYIANSYLSKRKIESLDEIKLSPLFVCLSSLSRVSFYGPLFSDQFINVRTTRFTSFFSVITIHAYVGNR